MFDVEEHIKNTSSYQLSFFQKLVLCRGLNFAIPQVVSAMDVEVSFEKAYWKLDPALLDEKKELAAATFPSIVLNYIESKGPRPPKSLVKAVNELKRRNDIVITKADKGSGMVIMDRTEYIRLLCEASITDTSNFIPVSNERPNTKGRPLNTTTLNNRKKNISSRLYAEFCQSLPGIL